MLAHKVNIMISGRGTKSRVSCRKKDHLLIILSRKNACFIASKFEDSSHVPYDHITTVFICKHVTNPFCRMKYRHSERFVSYH